MQRSEAMIFRLIALVSGCLAGGAAQAATTCTFGASPGFTIPTYTEAQAASSATSVTVNCNRAATSDPATVTYTVTFGPGNNNKRAAAVVNGTSYYVAYSVAGTAPACSPAVTTVTGTITWPTTGAQASRIGTLSSVANYAGCVAPQALIAAATYTDTIGLTLTHNAGTGTATGTAPVTITRGSQCTVTQAPTTLAFNYTAFRSTALSVTSPLGITCSNTTPYTMALDVANGTVAGLAYSLALSALSATGTGTQQSHVITGTMSAGQPGDCTGSCTGSRAHSVVITY
jgi:spore coat protein U-like protein